MMERSRERLGPEKSSLWGLSVLLSWWWGHRAWAAGRPANAGETATEAETSITLTFLRKPWRWPAVPLFASRPLQPRCELPRYSYYSNYRDAFPRPGLGVMPSSQSTPAVAQPGLDTAANRLRRLRGLSLLGLARNVPSLDPRRIRLAVADHHASSLHLITGPTGPSALTSLAPSGGGLLRSKTGHDAVSDSRAGGRRGYS